MGRKKQFMPDGSPKCTQCAQPGVATWGKHKTWHCAKHHRFWQMKFGARFAKKREPSLEELEALFLEVINMQCPVCECDMVWFTKEDRKRTLTLQHDASGKLRMICFRCNLRHAALPSDIFYEVQAGSKYCHYCEQILPLSDFHPKSKYNRCRKCATARHGEWVNRNREHLKAYRKKLYDRNKAIRQQA